MYLKRRVRRKDGKEHVYYSIGESLRVHGGRTVQRQMLHLGELNTSQCESWQRTLEVINERMPNSWKIAEVGWCWKNLTPRHRGCWRCFAT